MTTPTFSELLASQEARDRAERFRPVEGNGTHWMTPYGGIYCCKDGYCVFSDAAVHAVWQGYLTDCPPPPEPRVFNKALYFNVYDDEADEYIFENGHATRKEADQWQSDSRIACVRVEITATENQFDD